MIDDKLLGLFLLNMFVWDEKKRKGRQNKTYEKH